MANSDSTNSPELTRLCRLTDEEADLVLDIRMLSPETKQAIRSLVEAGVKYSAKRYESETGNVVGIARRPD